jgi:hypothetical protein
MITIKLKFPSEEEAKNMLSLVQEEILEWAWADETKIEIDILAHKKIEILEPYEVFPTKNKHNFLIPENYGTIKHS